ncbi:MAG: TIGR02281 family clan AA aspartic protease [Methylophaga sp.]|nr:MAG: TIGR02281 family clan AA aspartic protease [Methylophaga sp.]
MAIIWIIVLMVATTIFNGALDDINNPNKQLTVSINQNGSKQIVLERNRYGHYVATGKINGQSVEFLLDTGATLVAIPEHIAKKLSLIKGQGFQSETANGMSQSYATHLDTVSLGDIVISNVQGSISMGMEFDEVLLGMSFLKHLQMTQQGKTLTISIPE